MPIHHKRAARPDPVMYGSTAVIAHLVRAGCEPAYEAWLETIAPAAQRWPGQLVGLMMYVGMPHYTRAVSAWLFRE